MCENALSNFPALTICGSIAFLFGCYSLCVFGASFLVELDSGFRGFVSSDILLSADCGFGKVKMGCLTLEAYIPNQGMLELRG